MGIKGHSDIRIIKNKVKKILITDNDQPITKEFPFGFNYDEEKQYNPKFSDTKNFYHLLMNNWEDYFSKLNRNSPPYLNDSNFFRYGVGVKTDCITFNFNFNDTIERKIEELAELTDYELDWEYSTNNVGTVTAASFEAKRKPKNISNIRLINKNKPKSEEEKEKPKFKTLQGIIQEKQSKIFFKYPEHDGTTRESITGLDFDSDVNIWNKIWENIKKENGFEDQQIPFDDVHMISKTVKIKNKGFVLQIEYDNYNFTLRFAEPEGFKNGQPVGHHDIQTTIQILTDANKHKYDNPDGYVAYEKSRELRELGEDLLRYIYTHAGKIKIH